jgi:hypothetical protein
VCYSQIVREHAPAIADAKILVGFEGVEPSRLTASVSETDASAKFRQKPNFDHCQRFAPANKKPGALARQPGFCSSSDTACFRCSISQVLPLAMHLVLAACFSHNRRPLFRGQSSRGNPVDAAPVWRTYRPLTAARSKSKVVVSMSSSALFKLVQPPMRTPLLRLAKKQCKPTSRFGGDRFADLETTIRLISALLLAGQPSGAFSAMGAG